MIEQGVHYLALTSIKARLEQNEKDYAQASVQLQEALAMGDLRENSEYDAAKESLGRIVKERDSLAPLLLLPVVKCNDTASIIEEGCVLSIKVFSVLSTPISTKSEEFKTIIQGTPGFEGVVMFGGTVDAQELLVDSALSAETPIGKYLLGKTSGEYCIQVPGGFVPVVVQKLRESEFTLADIKCEYHGGA